MKNIQMPKVESTYYPMKGGLDLVTPPMKMDSGKVIDSLNYEPVPVGGYRRINGFERSDGQTAPTSANYWILGATITGTIAVGNTVTGATSAATGKVLAISGSALVLGRVAGTFVSGEALKVAGVTQATSTTAAVQNSAPLSSDNADYKLLAANDRRADILVVPGSGAPRGGFTFNDVTYAFRDNALATAGDLYKQTGAGWVKVDLGREIQFVARSGTVTITIAAPGVVTFTGHGLANGQTVALTTTGALPTGLTAGTNYYVINAAANTFQLSLTSGGSAITTTGTQSGTHTATLTSGTGFTVGATVTGASSGATAVVKAVLLRTGTWNVSPVGTLVFATVTGAFTSGEALKTGSLTQVQASTADTAVTRAVGGRIETVTDNFTGSTSTKRVYGVDGVNLAFEFDGTTYVPIRTGMTTDTPSHVAVHRFYLMLSFDGSLQISSLGNPYQWTAVTGAAEIAMGDTITALVSVAGNSGGASLLVTTKGRTSILYGASLSTFQLIPSVSDIGYAAYTVQPVSNNTYGLTARGVQALTTTQQYGNFLFAALSFLVQPMLERKAGLQTASVSLRTKNQYRVFFSDNTGLVFGLTGERISGIMPVDYGIPVRTMWSATLSTGEEVTYFTSDDGYVYKDNVGTSFDGAVIASHIRLPFNNLQSPQVRKTYRRAVFEVSCEGFSMVSATYDLGYASSGIEPPAVQADQSLAGAGGYWDSSSFYFDQFTWDAPVVSDAQISIDGTATNISFLFHSSRAQDDPHIVGGVNLLYTPRRLVHSGT